jgi:hypothetical protein
MLSDYFKVYKEAALRLYEFSLLVLIYEENHEFIQLIHSVNFIDFNTAVHFLETRGYVKRFGDQPTDVMLRKPAENMFKHLETKKKPSLKRNEDVAKWFDQWRDLFPAGSNSIGYRYRGNRLDGLKKMVKFVNSYPYTKEEIFQATKNYVDRFAIRGYNYMQQAHYFIDKQGVGSSLASECEDLRSSPTPKQESGYGGEVI